MVIITGSASLRVIDFGGNPIGDDGMSLMIEGLQKNNLTTLGVCNCGLSEKGTIIV